MGIQAKYQEMSSNTWLKLKKKPCHSNISTIKFVNIMMRNPFFKTTEHVDWIPFVDQEGDGGSGVKTTLPVKIRTH